MELQTGYSASAIHDARMRLKNVKTIERISDEIVGSYAKNNKDVNPILSQCVVELENLNKAIHLALKRRDQLSLGKILENSFIGRYAYTPVIQFERTFWNVAEDTAPDVTVYGSAQKQVSFYIDQHGGIYKKVRFTGMVLYQGHIDHSRASLPRHAESELATLKLIRAGVEALWT